MSEKTTLGENGIYDAKSLGVPKMLLLGLQHMFAMFGATILVPMLTGLDVSTTLLFAGLGTLLFHLLTKRKVPAFLGSSFAFLGGYAAIAPMADGADNSALLPYACFGVACSGLLYLVLSLLIKIFGTGKVMRFFPPIVTGPIIIAIGLTLSQSAINNCSADWLIAVVAIALVVICNIWGKGMVKIVPIIIGVIGSYVVAAILGRVDFTPVAEAAWIGLPIHWNETAFWALSDGNTSLLITSVITIMPIALATMGLGRMMGIELPANFRRPYMARSVRDFYRRWHMTLGQWFCRYVYIPLGGSRQGELRTIFNLLVVWMLTAFWHGAGWNFFCWGGLLWICIVLERQLGRLKFVHKMKVLPHIYLWLVIPMSWMCFAITDLSQLQVYLDKMLWLVPGFSGGYEDAWKALSTYGGLLLVSGLACTPVVEKLYHKWQDKLPVKVLLSGLFWYCIWRLLLEGNNPFMYFSF